jgi:hypothetical protein
VREDGRNLPQRAQRTQSGEEDRRLGVRDWRLGINGS